MVLKLKFNIKNVARCLPLNRCWMSVKLFPSTYVGNVCSIGQGLFFNQVKCVSPHFCLWWARLIPSPKRASLSVLKTHETVLKITYLPHLKFFSWSHFWSRPRTASYTKETLEEKVIPWINERTLVGISGYLPIGSGIVWFQAKSKLSLCIP